MPQPLSSTIPSTPTPPQPIRRRRALFSDARRRFALSGKPQVWPSSRSPSPRARSASACRGCLRRASAYPATTRASRRREPSTCWPSAESGGAAGGQRFGAGAGRGRRRQPCRMGRRRRAPVRRGPAARPAGPARAARGVARAVGRRPTAPLADQRARTGFRAAAVDRRAGLSGGVARRRRQSVADRYVDRVGWIDQHLAPPEPEALADNEIAATPNA